MVAEEKNDIGQVLNEHSHLHFKVEGGMPCKFIGKTTNDQVIFEAQFAIVKNVLAPNGTTTIKKKNGVVVNGKAIPQFVRGEYKSIFLDSEDLMKEKCRQIKWLFSIKK